jgi:hypothetical protein
MSTAAIAENPRAIIGANQPPPLRDILAENHAGLIAEIDPLAERANAAPKDIAGDSDITAIGDIVVDARKLSRRLDQAREAEKRPHLEAGREIDGYFKAMVERVDRIAAVLQKRADDYQRARAEEARRAREAEARRIREEEERQRRIAEEEAARNRPVAAEKHQAKAEQAADRAAEVEASAQASAADLTRVRSETGTVASARTSWNFEITDYSAVPLEKLRPYLARADVEKAIRSFVRVNKGAEQLAGIRIFEDIKANFR